MRGKHGELRFGDQLLERGCGLMSDEAYVRQTLLPRQVLQLRAQRPSACDSQGDGWQLLHREKQIEQPLLLRQTAEVENGCMLCRLWRNVRLQLLEVRQHPDAIDGPPALQQRVAHKSARRQ